MFKGPNVLIREAALHKINFFKFFDQEIGLLAQLISSRCRMREVVGSIPGPVKSDTVSPPLRCFFGAVLPRR